MDVANLSRNFKVNSSPAIKEEVSSEEEVINTNGFGEEQDDDDF